VRGFIERNRTPPNRNPNRGLTARQFQGVRVWSASKEAREEPGNVVLRMVCGPWPLAMISYWSPHLRAAVLGVEGLGV
jgi:hypothetical protein